jgi:4-amino-4-deoxy-L-arabinose transferase-like glycosyltransferase
MKNRFIKWINPDWAVLVPALLALVFFKIPQLPLPSFWDEAWSYLPAILNMAETGPSLLPDPQTAELYRGHPLFFYFTSSVWVVVFGRSFILMRLFPLIISMLLLTVLYFFANKHFGRKIAAVTTLFMLIQSVFIAQSSMLLPEMMLALLSLLTLDAFLSGKKVRFILWGTLLALTKETGLVLILACIFIRMTEPWWNREAKSLHDRIAGSWHLLVPLLMTALFFIVQKIIMGWFFFPEHIGFLNFTFGSLVRRLGGYSSYLFIGFGRNLLSIFAGVAVLVMVVRKHAINPQQLKVVLTLLLFMVFYLLFLSVNFYSPRYLLSILPLFILLCVFVISGASEPYRYLHYLILLVIFANNLWFTWDKRTDADHNLGYADAVGVTEQVTAFCSEQNWEDRHIATHFLMRQYLALPSAGYIGETGVFRHLETAVTDSTDIAVISSVEYTPAFRKQIEDRNGILVKRFERNNSWSEAYRFR